MVQPAAKKDFALEHMVSKTTGSKVKEAGTKTLPKGPRASSAQYRGTKVAGKYERTSGGATKLPGAGSLTPGGK